MEEGKRDRLGEKAERGFRKELRGSCPHQEEWEVWWEEGIPQIIFVVK